MAVNTNKQHRSATDLIFIGSRINIAVIVRLPVLYRGLSLKARNCCFGLSLFMQSPYHTLSQIMKTLQMHFLAISIITIFVCLELYFSQNVGRLLCNLQKLGGIFMSKRWVTFLERQSSVPFIVSRRASFVSKGIFLIMGSPTSNHWYSVMWLMK